LNAIINLYNSPEGRFVDDVVVRYTMFQQYKTICRHPNSLLQALQRAHPETGQQFLLKSKLFSY
jgi:hypothetical protein